MKGFLIRREDRDPRREAEGRVTTGRDESYAAIRPRNAKGCQEPAGARKRQRRILP